MIKKIFFFLFIIFFFLLFVFLGSAVIYSEQKNISIMEELKTDSKNILLQMKNIIYYEATKRNPAGDILPDNLDNKIKNEIKERI